MKEIKFRAWDKILEKMLPMTGFAEKTIFVKGGTRPLVNQVVMQYTGLLDKNGKEIYEGDIIKDTMGDIREVIFDEGGYWCKYPNGDKFMPFHESREVIGNKFEHSELLK